jgi:diguanylate cyclase (GGDEF)-like protein
MPGSSRFEDDAVSPAQDLRQQVAAIMHDRAPALVSDTVAIFPFIGNELLEPDYCKRLGDIAVQLLSLAIREGRVDPRSGGIAELNRVALERSVLAGRLFTLVYLLERSALDELAVSEAVGATSEPWPLVAQLVRRASFDVLAAYTERLQLDPKESIVVDKLTTLYARPMFDAALAKEIVGAGRYGYAISVILFDVDRLSQINQEHGYGVGDKILERLGILIRQYFRHQDWVARYSEDSIVVLLARTGGAPANELAERVRATVQDRLEFIDHRTDKPVRVTISAAVVTVPGKVGETVDTERLLADAEAALDRAKQQGRNRVERVDTDAPHHTESPTPPAAGVQPPYSSS